MFVLFILVGPLSGYFGGGGEDGGTVEGVVGVAVGWGAVVAGLSMDPLPRGVSSTGPVSM